MRPSTLEQGPFELLSLQVLLAHTLTGLSGFSTSASSFLSLSLQLLKVVIDLIEDTNLCSRESTDRQALPCIYVEVIQVITYLSYACCS